MLAHLSKATVQLEWPPDKVMSLVTPHLVVIVHGDWHDLSIIEHDRR